MLSNNDWHFEHSCDVLLAKFHHFRGDACCFVSARGRRSLACYLAASLNQGADFCCYFLLNARHMEVSLLVLCSSFLGFFSLRCSMDSLFRDPVAPPPASLALAGHQRAPFCTAQPEVFVLSSCF
jgi:hypothetical protein